MCGEGSTRNAGRSLGVYESWNFSSPVTTPIMCACVRTCMCVCASACYSTLNSVLSFKLYNLSTFCRYEMIFGRHFISTGGKETTEVRTATSGFVKPTSCSCTAYFRSFVFHFHLRHFRPSISDLSRGSSSMYFLLPVMRKLLPVLFCPLPVWTESCPFVLQEFLKRLSLRRGDQVLDVGCGIGGSAFMMAEVRVCERGVRACVRERGACVCERCACGRCWGGRRGVRHRGERLHDGRCACV